MCLCVCGWSIEYWTCRQAVLLASVSRSEGRLVLGWGCGIIVQPCLIGPGSTTVVIASSPPDSPCLLFAFSNNSQEMKKAHAEKKKDLKKKMKQTLKEDDKKLADIAASGKSMIDYLKNENKKLKDQQVTMKTEYQTLEKQTDILNQKGEEIARNFARYDGCGCAFTVALL